MYIHVYVDTAYSKILRRHNCEDLLYVHTYIQYHSYLPLESGITGAHFTWMSVQLGMCSFSTVMASEIAQKNYFSEEKLSIAKACIKKTTLAKASYTLIIATFMTLSLSSHQEWRLQKARVKVLYSSF